MNMIELWGVNLAIQRHFWAPPVKVLNELTLKVEPGSCFGLLGPNGAGKTTTLRVVLGLAKPQSGTVKLFDKNPRDRHARTGVGFMPEQPYFPRITTARELVEDHARLLGMTHKEATAKAQDALERVALRHDAWDNPLRSYSKGMIQRTGLAQAIVGDPKLLILDEPMSGLDPTGRYQVRELLRELQVKGTTIVFSSHILGDVASICDRIAMLKGGKVVASGQLDELIPPPTEWEWVAQFPNDAPLEPKLKQDATPLGNQRFRWITPKCDLDQPEFREVLEVGGRIESVIPHRPSLEDVFLKLLNNDEEQHKEATE